MGIGRIRYRLLVVGPLPPPVGGVETMTKAVLESLALAEFETRHCDLTKGRAKSTQGRFDIGNFRWAIIHFSRMVRQVVAFRPDVVYMPLTGTWSGFLRDCVLAVIAKIGKAKVVGHVHGGAFDRILAPRGLTEVLVRRCLSQFDLLLMLGKKWKQAVDTYKTECPSIIVPPTLNGEIVEAGRDFERDYDVSDPVGLYVGHVGIRKGVIDLLDALSVLRNSQRPARLIIVGPEQRQGDWDMVMDRYKELRLQDIVEFKGALMGDALLEQYRRADYFVLPSYIEGLPIVFMEAAAFGLPVIGTPVGAIEDFLIHENNALLVEPGAVGQLAEAIDRLRSSTVEREKYGRRLRVDVAKYHPDVVCDQVSRAIQSVMSKT